MEHFKIFEEFMSPVDLKQLKDAAKTIKHCGDYGLLYMNDKGDVFWTCGDADGENGTHNEDEIRDIFSKVDGIGKIEIEAECMPNDDDGYVRIKYK